MAKEQLARETWRMEGAVGSLDWLGVLKEERRVASDGEAVINRVIQGFPCKPCASI